MKKVLVVSFYFLKKESTGSSRAQGLVRHLPEFGWEPVVLTAKSGLEAKSDAMIIETPFEDLRDAWKRKFGLKKGVRLKEQLGMSTRTRLKKRTIMDRMLGIWESTFAKPDLMKLWRPHAVEAGLKMIRDEEIDLIFSTAPPHTTNLIASELSSRTGIPWVADFRDLWTQNPYYPYNRVRKMTERRREIRTLSSAAALITVSEPLAKEFGSLHHDKQVLSIENGFDSDLRRLAGPLSRKFTIVHAGQLYWGRRDPLPLFEALRSLASEGAIDPDEVQVDFYGFEEGWLDGEIERCAMGKMARNHGVVPKDEVIGIERAAQLLLLLTWSDPREKGVYTGKLFEYLAMRRPVLATGMHGSVVEELLEETGAGTFASTVDEIKAEIRKAYGEFKSTGRVTYHGIESKTDKYCHREMTKKFAAVFDRVLPSDQ